MTLHIYSQDTNCTDQFNRMASLCVQDDAILLIENGVAWAQSGYRQQQGWSNLPEGVQCYVLADDLAARGLDGATMFSRIDYAGFVRLTEEHANSITW